MQIKDGLGVAHNDAKLMAMKIIKSEKENH
jgi:hypothetical protein